VIEMLISGFEDVEIREFRLLPAGDRVVALLHTRSRGEQGDLQVETRDAHLITFRDGKITYWRLYLDQAEALQDAGLDPELASNGTRSAS
jgi:ketosteroid isomerase-like protein